MEIDLLVKSLSILGDVNITFLDKGESHWNNGEAHYLVRIKGIETKDYPTSGILAGVCGRGGTIQMALLDFRHNLTGKIVIKDAGSPTNRREYIVI